MGVDVDQREGNMSEKGFARQPEQNCAVLSHRPQHPQILKICISFTQNVNAAIFKFFQMFHIDKVSLLFLLNDLVFQHARDDQFHAFIHRELTGVHTDLGSCGGFIW